jgi:hypothetical protein
MFVIVCGGFEWKQICAGFLSFVYTSICRKESLNNDGHQFHQYQQNKQSPLILAKLKRKQ